MGAFDPNTIEESLIRLQGLTDSDLASIGWENHESGTFHWHEAVGNRNDRYQLMVIRRGVGVAGRALRLGRYVLADWTKDGDEEKDCPIMIAEKLKTALAVPIMDEGKAVGIVLLGRRTGRPYGPNDIEYTTKSIPLLKELHTSLKFG